MFVVPGLEAFGRPAGDIREQLAPVFLRFLLAAELSIHRNVFDVGVNRLLVRVQAAKLERAFVVALQIVVVPRLARCAPWSIFTAGRPWPLDGRRSPFRVIGYRDNVLMWSGKLSKADLDRLAYWEKSNATTAAAT
jgi:hypothetical protein